MAFNPFRDLIDVLTGRTGEPTIRTADEPHRVRNTGTATATGPGSFANTGSIRTPRPPRVTIDPEPLRRAVEDLARAAQQTNRNFTMSTTTVGGVSTRTDRNGTHITVGRREIRVDRDGNVNIDGVAITDAILSAARRQG